MQLSIQSILKMIKVLHLKNFVLLIMINCIEQ